MLHCNDERPGAAKGIYSKWGVGSKSEGFYGSVLVFLIVRLHLPNLLIINSTAETIS